MKLLTILILQILLAANAMAAPYVPQANPIKQQLNSPIGRPDQPAKRGPFQTMSVKNSGLNVTFQEGINGPNWTQLTGREYRLTQGAVRLSAAPTVLLRSDGSSGVGASLKLQLQDIVSLSHTSHFGAAERHMTSVTLAPKSTVSVRALSISGGQRSTTRVGPAVKVSSNLNVWYGVGTGGASDLVLMTGNLRF